jgi:hypothetical protein
MRPAQPGGARTEEEALVDGMQGGAMGWVQGHACALQAQQARATVPGLHLPGSRLKLYGPTLPGALPGPPRLPSCPPLVSIPISALPLCTRPPPSPSRAHPSLPLRPACPHALYRHPSRSPSRIFLLALSSTPPSSRPPCQCDCVCDSLQLTVCKLASLSWHAHPPPCPPLSLPLPTWRPWP